MPISDEGREALREERREPERDRAAAPGLDYAGGVGGFAAPAGGLGARTGDFAVPHDTHDRNPGVDQPESPLFGEDRGREEYVNDLAGQPARPLSDDEKEAAEHDPGRPERVYAPASARVAKEPAPGDDKLIHGER